MEKSVYRMWNLGMTLTRDSLSKETFFLISTSFAFKVFTFVTSYFKKVDLNMYIFVLWTIFDLEIETTALERRDSSERRSHSLAWF